MKRLLYIGLIGLSTTAMATVEFKQHLDEEYYMSSSAPYIIWASSVTNMRNDSNKLEHYTVHIEMCSWKKGCTPNNFKEVYLRPGEHGKIELESGFNLGFVQPGDYEIRLTTWSNKNNEILRDEKKAIVHVS